MNSSISENFNTLLSLTNDNDALNGKVISSVSWNKSIYENFDDSNSGPILLGLDDGKIIEIELNGLDKSGKRTIKYFQQVYQIFNLEPIVSINVESFPGRQNQKLVFITSPSRMYQIIGIIDSTNNDNISNKNPSKYLNFFSVFGNKPNYLEIGEAKGSGSFCLFTKYQEYSLDSSANSFAWLTSNGVYFGSLSYGSQQAGDSVIESANLIPYSDNPDDLASHVLLTEFHVLVLVNNHIKAISRLNGDIVYDEIINSDSAQISILATWVVEIYLVILGNYDEKILVGTHKDGSMNNTALDVTVELKLSTDEFHTFLDSYKTYLDPKKILGLISSHGRSDSKNYYAFLLKDYSFIIEEHLLRSEYDESLEVLEKYGKPSDFYKHSTQLIKCYPKRLVDILIRRRNVDPSKLIPAFIEYEKSYSQQTIIASSKEGSNQIQKCNHVVRYLDFVIYHANNRNKSVHHYYFNLFAKSKQSSELSLQKYLEHFQHDHVCELDYLLAECLKYNRISSAAFIYSNLGYYEDAVDLSLMSGDVELAIMQTTNLRNSSDPLSNVGLLSETPLVSTGGTNAISSVQMFSNEPTNEREKRLWTKIATYALITCEDYNLALSLTKRTNLLKIKDLIKLQPSFVNIDLVRESLCTSLEEQEQEIKTLYMDMNESMKNAGVVSKEILGLNNRYSIVAENEMCMICCQPALTKVIYVFPCQHIFHCDCLTRKVLMGSVRVNIKKIKSLQYQLASIGKQRREMRLENIGGLLVDNDKKKQTKPTKKSRAQEIEDSKKEKELISSEVKVRRELDNLVARECILCGETNVKSIGVPLVDIDKDYDSIMSWRNDKSADPGIYVLGAQVYPHRQVLLAVDVAHVSVAERRACRVQPAGSAASFRRHREWRAADDGAVHGHCGKRRHDIGYWRAVQAVRYRDPGRAAKYQRWQQCEACRSWRTKIGGA
ncbi:Vacuolar protein sorting-associated protein 18-like protein [Smittium culicis]|uniref:Vacuolar protein sorting-associated protein 18-like protein n=1 Tax=Smittium culicis TaxID=133412 RepID=A0A1R1YAR6_9FUNG|nr:Vacuolar protein sorting-associated protein 18-like protein [Smittium culicis]OMJ23935.1 Vacuolar protein sorting-associated protein 18-like protein [Smittium culicis]